jgi:hypothetical protein
MATVGARLDERGRRLFAAVEVRSAGRGGLALLSKMRIPTQSGQGFRFDVGHRSDLIPATVPK